MTRMLGTKGGMLSDLWYRGVNEGFRIQAPRVYREKFTKRAESLKVKGDPEDKRLHLERVMISQFKTAGTPFLSGFDDAQIYMTAQHYGMPTRLLDWSTNPLAALFFACEDNFDKDGFVYAMDAGLIIPDKALRGDGIQVHRAVMTTRHPYVQKAIAFSFWADIEKKWTPYVLPGATGFHARKDRTAKFLFHVSYAPSGSGYEPYVHHPQDR